MLNINKKIFLYNARIGATHHHFIAIITTTYDLTSDPT